MEAKEPQINMERNIRIRNGRHPLMSREHAVPLSFELGDRGNGVVITGPNTGGKTVTMKTVGLFCIMAQCGLHVPCEEASLCMNNQVLCDIGDGQNISENLSTFSAHITNVLDILKKAGPESLVLLDELGSGYGSGGGNGDCHCHIGESEAVRMSVFGYDPLSGGEGVCGSGRWC